ncbi:MAG TPA: sulfur carrier protein ThiS [Pseudomonadales bacterium]
MKVIVNGDTLEVGQNSSLTALVEQLGLTEKRIAIELNREIIPKGLHGETQLQAGDTIEVVQAIGGG